MNIITTPQVAEVFWLACLPVRLHISTWTQGSLQR